MKRANATQAIALEYAKERRLAKPIQYVSEWSLELAGVKLVSVLNAREHWAKRAKRTSQHRNAVYWAWIFAEQGYRVALKPPAVVRITRRGPRKLDSDNLAASAKAVRDAIAEMLGCDDADHRVPVAWEYAQETARDYSVGITIRSCG